MRRTSPLILWSVSSRSRRRSRSPKFQQLQERGPRRFSAGRPGLDLRHRRHSVRPCSWSAPSYSSPRLRCDTLVSRHAVWFAAMRKLVQPAFVKSAFVLVPVLAARFGLLLDISWITRPLVAPIWVALVRGSLLLLRLSVLPRPVFASTVITPELRFPEGKNPQRWSRLRALSRRARGIRAGLAYFWKSWRGALGSLVRSTTQACTWGRLSSSTTANGLT